MKGWSTIVVPVLLLSLSYEGISAQASNSGCPPAGSNSTVMHLPDPHSCQQYLACSRGIAYSMICPSGLHFNPALQLCDWPKTANCKSMTTSTTSTTTPLPTRSTTTQSSSTTATARTTTAAASLSTSCGAEDVAGISVLLPHRSRCDYYYICTGGTRTVCACRSGFHFSPALRACVLKAEAGCGTSTSSAATGASTTRSPTTPTRPSITTARGGAVCSQLLSDPRGQWIPETCTIEGSRRYSKCNLNCDEGFKVDQLSSWVWCSLDGWLGMEGLHKIPHCNPVPTTTIATTIAATTIAATTESTPAEVLKTLHAKTESERGCLSLPDPPGGHWVPSSCSQAASERYDFCDLYCDPGSDLWGWVMCTDRGWYGPKGLHGILTC